MKPAWTNVSTGSSGVGLKVKSSGLRPLIAAKPPVYTPKIFFRRASDVHVRSPDAFADGVDKWEKEGLNSYGDRYCGYDTIEGVKTALQALRARESVNLPLISPYSFRHKVTSVLRTSRVPEDQVSQMLGHRRANLRTTAGYGEWDPTYLADAAAAIDAWFARVQKYCTRALYSHGIPTVAQARKKRTV